MENLHIVSSDPEVINAIPTDNILGGKKRKRRRKAKRKAKRAAKGMGIKGKERRRLGRAARQGIRAQQLRKKGKHKKAARVLARGGETAVGRGVRSAVFAPLFPLRKTMEKALKRMGVKPPRKMRDLAPLFFRKVVKRNSYEVSDNLDPITITAIVAAIISYFKERKKAKEEGRDMPPVDEIIASGAIAVSRSLKKRAQQRDIDQGFTSEPGPADRALVAKELLIEPLRPVMVSSLKKIGVQPPSDIKDITVTFYNRIVEKHANSYVGFDNADGDATATENTSVIFQTIVPAVIGFIGAIKTKQEEGGNLTRLEQIIADKTDKVKALLESGAQKEVENRAGQFLLKPSTMLIIGVSVIALIILISKRA